MRVEAALGSQHVSEIDATSPLKRPRGGKIVVLIDRGIQRFSELPRNARGEAF